MKFLKKLIAPNSSTRFLAVSAVVATLLFLDNLRAKRESAFPTLTPAKSHAEIAERSAQYHTLAQQNKPEEPIPAHALSIEADQAGPERVQRVQHVQHVQHVRLPDTRKRVAQLLQRMRRPDISKTPRQDSTLITNVQAAQLMTAADRFMCTTEMATLLAIMHLGGPQQLLYWDDEWDAITSRSVYRLHQHLKQGCKDDIELALKLYAAWSETAYHGHSFIPTWAMRAVWLTYRIPPLPASLEETLGDTLFSFKKAISNVLEIESFEHLAEQYGIKELATDWLAATKTAFQQARREAWSRAYYVNHGLLTFSVEPERERLLSELTINKKIVERRPINFDLLERVRIIFAYYMVQHSSTGPLLPRTIAIQPEWKEWLQQTERTPLALARFIAQNTPRDIADELLPTHTDTRLFAEQYLPCGSRYLGTVTTLADDGSVEFALGRRISDAPPVLETFRNEAVTLCDYDTQDKDERKERIEEALLTSQSNATPYRRESMHAIGILQAPDDANQPTSLYHLNDTLIVEVIDYPLDNPTQLRALVAVVPEHEPFDTFAARYQVGDVLTVTTQAYDQRPDDTLISLLVCEPISQLVISIDPEHLSFTPLDEAIKEIPLGMQLHVVLEEIDIARRVVTLSLLPLMGAYLERLLKTHKHSDGSYEATAIISKVFAESLLLVLTWSEPTLGFIFALDIPRHALPEPQRDYEVGEQAQLALTFPDTVASPTLAHLPTSVNQLLTLPNTGLHLFWQSHKLHFSGQMSFMTRNTLLALSNDRFYQYAIHSLYRASYQWLTEVIAFRPAMSAFEIGTHTTANYTPVLESLEAERDRVGEGESVETLLEEIFDEGVDTATKETVHLPPELPPLLKYQVNQIVQGRVTGVLTYGAFVEIEPEVNGLVHRSKLWGHVPDVTDVVHIGDEVNVRILNINLEERNLELSMQLPEYDPLGRYEVDEVVTGIVTDIQEFGAFVEIEPGVSGLVHKSKMWGYVADIEDVVSIGEEVTVRILDINTERRWMELSMQVPEHDPLLRYHVGEIVTGRVTKVEEFGAFVEIEPGATGLVHKHDIRDNLNDARRELFAGEEVDVLIVRIDMEKRRMNLSMKDV